MTVPQPRSRSNTEELGAASASPTHSDSSNTPIDLLTYVTDLISQGQGIAGVLGVAVVSPVVFSLLPWLVAVFVAFLVGIGIEVGPGLVLEHLRQGQGLGDSNAAAALSTSARAPTPGPPLPPRRTISNNTSTTSSPSSRHVSLLGGRVEIKEWRVVEGDFASYKVTVGCGDSILLVVPPLVQIVLLLRRKFLWLLCSLR